MVRSAARLCLVMSCTVSPARAVTFRLMSLIQSLDLDQGLGFRLGSYSTGHTRSTGSGSAGLVSAAALQSRHGCSHSDS